MNPTVEELRRVFAYDPETGAISRLSARRRVDLGATGHLDAKGYVRIWFNGQKLYGHRIAWALHHGEWPTEEIDHANGDTGDNRLSNLRSAKRRHNSWNRGANPNSPSGYKGVHWDSRSQCYRAKIVFNGKTWKRGTYATPEEAARRYDRLAKQVHGPFARLNFPVEPVHGPVQGQGGSKLAEEATP